MATVKQSVQMYNRDNISVDQQSFSAIAIFLAKRFDVVQRAVERLRKNDGKDSRGGNDDKGLDSKNSGDNGVKEVVDVLERMEKNLKSIDSNVDIIKQQTKTMDDYFKDQQKKKEQKEEVISTQGGSSVLVTKVASKFSKYGNLFEYGYDVMTVTTVGYAFAQMLSDFWARTGNDPVLNQQQKEATSEVTVSTATETDKQAQLETALSNLLEGFNIWRATNAPTADAKQDNLNARLDALITGIKDWQINRAVPTMVEQQKKLNTRLNVLASGINTWQVNRETTIQDDRQTGLNKRLDALVGGVEEWRETRTVPTTTDKQDKLNTRLNALATGIEEWRSGRKDNEEGMSRSDMLVKEFKDTITVMASFLKTGFEDPVKAVEKQFLHMGVVSIFVLRQMEAAIASVASALGSLQSTAITLASSAQATVPKAEKDLQYVPSVEKSLDASANVESFSLPTNSASKKSSVSMQQSADAYEISSQKANEINASASNQSGARQTIINMNSNMPVNASITNGMDMEMFLRQLGIGVDMAMRSAAEGVPL